MKKPSIRGIIAGIIILLLAVPLGDWYGFIYLMFSGDMHTERYIMLCQSAVTSFQIIGGIVAVLSGMAAIFVTHDK